MSFSKIVTVSAVIASLLVPSFAAAANKADARADGWWGVGWDGIEHLVSRLPKLPAATKDEPDSYWLCHQGGLHFSDCGFYIVPRPEAIRTKLVKADEPPPAPSPTTAPVTTTLAVSNSTQGCWWFDKRAGQLGCRDGQSPVGDGWIFEGDDAQSAPYIHRYHQAGVSGPAPKKSGSGIGTAVAVGLVGVLAGVALANSDHHYGYYRNYDRCYPVWYRGEYFPCSGR